MDGQNPTVSAIRNSDDVTEAVYSALALGRLSPNKLYLGSGCINLLECFEVDSWRLKNLNGYPSRFGLLISYFGAEVAVLLFARMTMAAMSLA